MNNYSEPPTLNFQYLETETIPMRSTSIQLLREVEREFNFTMRKIFKRNGEV